MTIVSPREMEKGSLSSIPVKFVTCKVDTFFSKLPREAVSLSSQAVRPIDSTFPIKKFMHGPTMYRFGNGSCGTVVI